MTTSQIRCGWVTADPTYICYHDSEWGVPVHDDRQLFEMLVLEGMQAGLSWLTILKRRPGYRQHFENFSVERIARYDAEHEARLLLEPAIIRNRLKISSIITNAQVFLSVQEAFGSFDAYLWHFVDGRPQVHHWTDSTLMPSDTPLARSISQDLRARGFRFVGPTIVYSYLQAVGVVMDHLVSCFRYAELGGDGPENSPSERALASDDKE